MSARKLLLADDSMTIQKVVQLTFAEEGIDVTIAADGESAMLKFYEFHPDIVLADVNMPGLSGYEVCEKIKSNSGSVPVVLLVGSFEQFDESEAQRVGADDSLRKPFQSIRHLIDTVTRLLEDRGEQTPSAAEPAMAQTTESPAQRPKEGLGDAGTDDEMIEATRFDGGNEQPGIGETEPVNEYHAPPVDETPSSSLENGETEDASSFDMAHVTEIDDDARSVEIPDRYPEQRGENREMAESIPAPIMELDDLNFLEIPVAGVPVLPPVEEQPLEDSFRTSSEPELSRELEDAIVDRVVEKLCGDSLRDVIRDAVREVTRERPTE